jgi:hypothetical protein
MFPHNAKSSREIFMRNNSAGTNAGANSAAASSRDTGGVPHAPGGNIPGLATLPTFAGAFAAQGGPSAGNVFACIMIGNDPALGGVTEIPAHITTISLNLLSVPAGFSATVPFLRYASYASGLVVHAFRRPSRSARLRLSLICAVTSAATLSSSSKTSGVGPEKLADHRWLSVGA